MIQIDEKKFLELSSAKSFEDLKEEILEWIDRSKRPSESGGYSNSFCADQILMIFYCVLHKLTKKNNKLTKKEKR